VLSSVSTRLGSEVPASFLFAVAGLSLLIVSKSPSLPVRQLEDRSRRLAEQIALLEEKLQRDTD